MNETNTLTNNVAAANPCPLNCYARVSVLFARSDSIYKAFGCDVWDAERDALKFQGNNPVIAHPPCRLWSRMRRFSTAPQSEKQLAIWAVEQVRKNGGVLEHPATSALWKTVGLPEAGKRDAFGGWVQSVSQWWFGHRADKLTKLYICGVEPENVPPIPFRLGEPEFTCSMTRTTKGKRKPYIREAERERTPVDFARWLIETALKTRRA